jgi:hypothetical protein
MQKMEQHRHFLAGQVIDAITANRTGAELGAYCRLIHVKVDLEFAKMYQELFPQKETKVEKPTRTDAKTEPAKNGPGTANPKQARQTGF